MSGGSGPTGRDRVDGLADAWRREMPSVAVREFELIKRTARLHALLEETLLAELAAFDLTRAEYDVLSTLRSLGPPYRMRPTDLRHRLVLSSGGTSNVLRRLHTAGLVRREPDESDGRGSVVTLTQAGIDLTHALVPATIAAQAKAFGNVADDTAAAASNALREVLLALGDREPAPEGGRRGRSPGRTS
ncbi:MarR family transcriptional regulator [Streptomyces sulfonofaciens]|uniref:MarR family transcriptional regulator n=1 Tax=Streptomyces sulfonofaciens TaxID=68272 RepID=A0A919GGP7_9ACTN|nr:MarR family transcriptional regulator [Streptomyces sulfonofaciens]GHH84109.1 MarR family transcriptional regulator [Streptomyces sulfonofaciens]